MNNVNNVIPLSKTDNVNNYSGKTSNPNSSLNLNTNSSSNSNNFANTAFGFYLGFGEANKQMDTNLNQVKKLQKDFAQIGYHIDAEIAYEVNNWYEINNQPLLVQGGPGTGKTTFAEWLAKIKGLEYYRFQCYPGVQAKDVLYWWNERLQDLLTKTAYAGANTNISEIKRLIYHQDCRIDGIFARALLNPKRSLIHLDEIDKADDKFEASLLQVSAEAKITIGEIDEEITSVSGVRPIIVYTSNAGVHGMKASLSQPLLRRCKLITLHKSSIIRQYLVLKDKFKELPDKLVRECVIFSYQLDEFVHMQKPTDLSEIINWMNSLRQSGATVLSWESVLANIGDLAKTPLDRRNLLASVDKIFDYIRQHATIDIKVLSDMVEANAKKRQ
jgi:MoxR-like ATPase